MAKTLTDKALDFDKKYMKPSLLIIYILVLAVILYFIGTPTMEMFKKIFYKIIIPIIQLGIIAYVLFVYFKGGLKVSIAKEIATYNRENVKRVLSQLWILSLLVPGSAQFLYGFTKRGIVIFLIAASALLSLIIPFKTLNIGLFIAIYIGYFIFWLWNLKDARKIVKQNPVI
jgi:hypothetical protein